MLGLLAETCVRPAGPSSGGILDREIARDPEDGLPWIEGPVLDRALGREAALDAARLLLLPVRSLSEDHRWITCPGILRRLAGAWTGKDPLPRWSPEVPPGQFLGEGPYTLHLEERALRKSSGLPPAAGAWIEALASLMADPGARRRLPRRLAVLDDRDFAWFSGSGLPLLVRHALEERTQLVRERIHEEALPPDTLMYARVRGEPEPPGYLRLGGGRSAGLGWMGLAWI